MTENGKDMLSYSYMFVRMFSRLNSGQLVTGSLDVSGTKLQIQVIERDCTAWENCFDTDQVTAIRNKCNAELTWQSFFELLQRTFAEHLIDWDDQARSLKFTVKHDRQSESLPFSPFVEHFTLTVEPASIPDFAKRTVDSMISFVMLRSGDRKEMDRVQDAVRIDAALQAESARYQDEVRGVTENIAKLTESCNEYERSREELAAKLNASSNAELKGNWENSLLSTNLETVVCRVPNPLKAPGVNRLKLDTELLRVLKSEANQSTYTNVHLYRYNNAVLPFPPDEKGSFMEKLSPPARGLYALLTNGVEQWEMNIFQLDEQAKRCGGNALVYLGYYILWKHSLPMLLNLDEQKVLNLLEMIAAGYKNNSLPSGSEVAFHTAIHAADVLHALNYMISQNDGVRRLKLKESHLLAAFMAALCHDFNHQGINNTFHTSLSTPLALAFADESSGEGFHCAQVFELMKLPDYDILDCCVPSTRQEIERVMTEMILATDMRRHQFFISAFEAKQGHLNFAHSHNIVITLCMLLKAADVSNCAKKSDLYLKWVGAISKEYVTQGKMEADAQLARSQQWMTSESSDTDQAKGQLGFINIVVLPLFSALSDIVPTLRTAAGQHLADNKRYWADKAFQA